mmetsp:Transcript_175126/g.561623  ORF Transcript_175126/g.561623 Transcript_175126/m.561623 type:complete len:353 (+) Transcript_175126:76-1134(+)|eukprot:CAMPEP_0177504750 /NCGR_PEP_ID=MMETSP0369-20130122/39030_1 /TAXON_ID=447022 ORGANISM="Scrippsiella hangoei-like, Strain SHHI-4" /NCGR_SAMPLE_ID=MMETSP0369 /ASSEMBLY_ACC=CAM_ASM_000364 /LENGTH=352 /DNA_ID=CAMNT_0018982555 /DNA_START=75 /DNA_END=1133 /DNA_ORIENTATION=+
MAASMAANVLRRVCLPRPVLPVAQHRTMAQSKYLEPGQQRRPGSLAPITPSTSKQRGSGAGRKDFTEDMPAHYQALQRISEQLSSPFSGVLGDMAGGPMQAYRERSQRLRQKSDQNKMEEVYEASRNFLMEPVTWTFGNMQAYQRKVLELAGATGWRRRISSDDPSILHLEKELRVLEAMTPAELMSNHKNVFTEDSKKLIAEKSGATVKYVESVIMEHDILRADRRWYKILMQFGRQLPTSFEDRSFMGESDRPFSESEREYQEKMIEKHRLKADRLKPPRMFNVYFRKPTCGGNQWSTRPPKTYPVQFKMRYERRERLRGVGVPGGGGDRGRPWGKLGQHFGGGYPAPVR